MKFEELYKQANDSIHADKNIIDTLFETKEEKSFFCFRSLSMCAAALVVIFSLSMLPKFHIGNNPAEQKVVYTPDKSDHTANRNKQQKNKKIFEDSAPKNNVFAKKSLPSDQNAAVVKEKTADVQTGSDSYSDVNSAYEEIMPITETEESPDNALSSVRIANIRDDSESTLMVSEISYTEYIKYLGWDILECNLKLPEGMEVSVPDTVQITMDKKSDKIIDDAINYSFTNVNNPYSYMSVSLSRIGDNINKDGYSTYRIVNETEIFVKEDDILREAYAKHNDVWLYITSIDVSMEEFDAFLNSLIF